MAGYRIKYGGFAFLVDATTGRPVGFRDERTAEEFFLPLFNDAQDGLKKPDGSNAAIGGGGEAGKSAYQVAVDNGFSGTVNQWLASLIGPSGSNGTNGKSAYQLAVDAGFVGNEATWRASLVGSAGPTGPAGPAANPSPTIDNVVWTNGLMTSYTEDGVAVSLTYDIDGNIASETRNGVTKSIVIDVNGRFAGFRP